ncbi:hypothetical protein RIF29_16014 [Crotalaria pallida]|uniref:Uncharacterized protein n=1 Tax=Crotalaria pallida TaxID=3830 RepID=A0AAN9IBN3_CROPI
MTCEHQFTVNTISALQSVHKLPQSCSLDVGCLSNLKTNGSGRENNGGTREIEGSSGDHSGRAWAGGWLEYMESESHDSGGRWQQIRICKKKKKISTRFLRRRRRRKQWLIVLIVVLVLLISCGKEGSDNMIKEENEKGDHNG